MPQHNSWANFEIHNQLSFETSLLLVLYSGILFFLFGNSGRSYYTISKKDMQDQIYTIFSTFSSLSQNINRDSEFKTTHHHAIRLLVTFPVQIYDFIIRLLGRIPSFSREIHVSISFNRFNPSTYYVHIFFGVVSCF